MKIFESTILNPYRSNKPKGFYHPVKHHTGLDLNYINEPLPSPISGKVVGITDQLEMGQCIYLQDSWGVIHVFAHLSEIKVKPGQSVKRDDIIAVTGNTGKKTTHPHLHWEVIVPRDDIWLVRTRGGSTLVDLIMTRSLLNFVGYNVDPIKYLKAIYAFYKVT